MEESFIHFIFVSLKIHAFARWLSNSPTFVKRVCNPLICIYAFRTGCIPNSEHDFIDDVCIFNMFAVDKTYWKRQSNALSSIDNQNAVNRQPKIESCASSLELHLQINISTLNIANIRWIEWVKML